MSVTDPLPPAAATAATPATAAMERPSLTELIVSLSHGSGLRREDPRRPRGPRLAVARPATWPLVMILCSLVLLSVVVAGTVIATRSLGRMVEALREHREARRQSPVRPLPPVAVLADDNAFATALAEWGGDPGRLWLGRARVLVSAGDDRGAIEAYRRASLQARSALPPAACLERAALLLRTGAYPECEELLDGVDPVPWTAEERAAVVALAGACHAARRAAERRNAAAAASVPPAGPATASAPP